MQQTNIAYTKERGGIEPRPSPFTIPSEYTQRSANVLIVDDDVDSVILIESIFWNLGCQTTCSLSSAEAKKKIYSHKADIIILDWVLDHHTNADTIVRHCTRVIDKFDNSNSHQLWHKPKIITYSSLDISEINILANPYFEHVDHWQKPMTQHDLLFKALSLLKKTGL